MMKTDRAPNRAASSSRRLRGSSSRRTAHVIAGDCENSRRRKRTGETHAVGRRPVRRFFDDRRAPLEIALAAALAVLTLETAHADPRGPKRVGGDIEAGRVLVAARELTDVNFSEAVVFVIKHDAEGTQGLIVNRTMGLPAGDVLPNLRDLLSGEHEMYFGGPVEPATVRVLAAVDSDLPGARRVTDDIALVNDVGVLRMHMMQAEPARVRFFSGYAGWAPGQLAEEIGRGEWYLRRRYRDVVFDERPQRLWPLLIEEVTGIYAYDEDHVR